MNTAIDRINALAEVVPNDVAAFLNAHLSVKNTREEVFKQYANAFVSDKDVSGQDLYLTDGCAHHIDEVEEKLWRRVCLALENWIYETFANE